jgi:hypothetical protein
MGHETMSVLPAIDPVELLAEEAVNHALRSVVQSASDG